MGGKERSRKFYIWGVSVLKGKLVDFVNWSLFYWEVRYSGIRVEHGVGAWKNGKTWNPPWAVLEVNLLYERKVSRSWLLNAKPKSTSLSIVTNLCIPTYWKHLWFQGHCSLSCPATSLIAWFPPSLLSVSLDSQIKKCLYPTSRNEFHGRQGCHHLERYEKCRILGSIPDWLHHHVLFNKILAAH